MEGATKRVLAVDVSSTKIINFRIDWAREFDRMKGLYEKNSCLEKIDLNKALLAAVQEGSPPWVKNILAFGADVNARDEYDKTVLMLAAIRGDMEKTNILVRSGADINAKTYDGWTALMFACSNGHTDVAAFLIEKGADVNIKDNDGTTPLKLALKWGHKDLIKLLKNAGAKM